MGKKVGSGSLWLMKPEVRWSKDTDPPRVKLVLGLAIEGEGSERSWKLYLNIKHWRNHCPTLRGIFNIKFLEC